MEPFMWLILLGGLGGGIALGFFIGQNRTTNTDKLKHLESELEKTKTETESFRDEVNEHFSKTAILFNQLTQDYRAMYEHIASGAETLTTDQSAKLKSLTSEAEPYERVVLEGENISPEPEMVEAKVAEQEPEEVSEATTEEAVTEKVEAKPEEEISTTPIQPLSEEESMEKKAEEAARTIH